MKGSNMRMLTTAAVVVIVVLAASFVYMSDDEGDMEGQIVIIHTNDTHGYYDENLGFAAVAELKSECESRGATVFLLDAGDAFQGTSSTALSHGETTIEVMNAVGYDVMCPGNHEFDYTFDTYYGYTEQLSCETVCANLDYTDTGESVFQEYVIIERDGVSLGIFGILTPDTEGSVKSGYMDGVTVTDPVEAATEMVEVLEEAGVDCIIALTHLGVGEGITYSSDYLCSEVDGIDICIDGHSHTAMSGGEVLDGSVELLESDTVIASTGCYLQYIGVIIIDEDGGITAALVSGCERDGTVQGVIDSIREEQDEYLGQVIGSTEIELDGDRLEARVQEVLVGDLGADAMLYYSGADVALVNGGGIRGGLSVGEITIGDVYDAYPYVDNYIQIKDVTGAELWEVMETSLSWLPGYSGSYQQIAGMTVVYDSSADAGSRVISITMSDGSPIDPEATYVVAANDYTMSSENFAVLGEKEVLSTLTVTQTESVVQYIRLLGTIAEDDVVTGRLVDVSAE